MSTAYISNIQILKAIDTRQQQYGGRPLSINAHDLLREMTGASAVDVQQLPGFLQELFVAQAASQLTWRLITQNVEPQNANFYLQQMYDLALTSTGQDRARNIVVVLPDPDPDDDKGGSLSDLILRQIGAAISHEYAPDEVETFLAEEGLPPVGLDSDTTVTRTDAHSVLAATWRAASLGRELVRRFIGRWVDGQLITGPDGELRATLLEQLARQGWQIRVSDSMLVAAEPVRGIPVSAPFLREARLHPQVEAQARPQFMIRKPEHAVLTSLRAVEIRVRALGGYPDQLIGGDLINRAFGSGGTLTDPGASKGEQEGMRALFAGGFSVLRNPAGHRQIDYDDLSEAAEAVQYASLLMRQLDRIDARLVAAGRTALVGTSPTP